MHASEHNTAPAEWDELGRLFPQPVFWQFFPGENTACSSSVRLNQVKIFWTGPSKCVSLWKMSKTGPYWWQNSMLKEMWVDKRLLLKVVTAPPRAMNANITELMEFPCQVFSIEKSENLRKLKLSEISKMGWEVTPFPRFSLTVGKPGGCGHQSRIIGQGSTLVSLKPHSVLSLLSGHTQ